MEGARRAEESDLALIAGLRDAGRRCVAGARGGPLLLRREIPGGAEGADLGRILEDPDRAVWVGTVDGQPVGYGLGRVERLDQGGSVHGVLDELYVDPEAREVGVGEALLQALLGWFVGQGCAGVDAMALPGDRAVKSFFEANGFKARLIVMHRSVLS